MVSDNRNKITVSLVLNWVHICVTFLYNNKVSFANDDILVEKIVEKILLALSFYILTVNSLSYSIISASLYLEEILQNLLQESGKKVLP